MVADIEEMDRIIGQFLDFARNEAATAFESADLNAIVARLRRPVRARRAERALRAGRGAARCRSSPPRSRASSPTSIDNALAYGAPPVEVTTSVLGGTARST